MEEITLPVDKVDIIISEWMGYFLLYESMLDSVLWARDRYLAPNGKMFPDRAIIYMAAIEDEDEKRRRGNFWKNQYNVDMSIMTNVVLKEPCIDYLNAFEDRAQHDMIISSTE
jgi:protein arginine N-methyltransferase 1